MKLKFSFALAAALFLPVPVGAQYNYSEPSGAHDVTEAMPASSTASSAPATVPESKSTLTSASIASYSLPTSTSTTRTPSSTSHAVLPSTTTTMTPSSAYPIVPASTTSEPESRSASSASHSVPTSTSMTMSSSSISHTIPPSTTTTRPTSSTYPTVKASTTARRPSSTYPAVPPASTTQIGVQVAPGGQLTYDPPSFEASNGTVVTFFFSSGYKRSSIAHSITQGSFAHPCVYLAAAGGEPAGFDSGLKPGGQFSIKITNDQQPIWFFCKSDKHCGQGMVGAINARPTGETYNAYLAAAKALGQNQNTLSDNGPVMGGLGASVLAMGGSSPTASATSSSSSSRSSSSHLAANGFFALLAAAFGMSLALA